MSKEVTQRGMLDVDLQIIDEYYTNGFQGYKAVQTVRPELSKMVAAVYWTSLQKRKDVQHALDEKKARLRATAGIEQEQILRELIQFAYSDATDYMGLTVDEFKALPSDVRRCIASWKHKKRTYYDRDLKENVTEELIEVKLVDKLAAIEKINKHIGFYDADNKQKRTNINIEKADSVTLNNLLQVYNESDKD